MARKTKTAVIAAVGYKAGKKHSAKNSTLRKASSQGKPAVMRLPAQPPVLMGLTSTVTLPPGQGPSMPANPNPKASGLSSSSARTQRISRPSTYGAKGASTRRGRAG